MTPEQLVAIIGAVVPLVAALGAIFVQVRQTHQLVNGKMQELVDVTRLAAAKQGELAGRDYIRPTAPEPPTAPPATGV